MSKFSISIVGMGYVGLCTAVGFTSKGNKVIAVDNDPEKVDSINKAVSPFHEPQLNDSLQKAVKDGYLTCILDLTEAILNSEITFITVGTPCKADGSIDLQQIQDSAINIGEALNKKDDYHLVVVKSTVVPGTTENFVKPLLEKHSNKHCGSDFGLCMNPEFLREGSAIHDTFHPDRVIIGECDKKSGDTLESLYKTFYAEECPVTIRTNLSTAELIKYANNAYLATKISYINTIANICEKIPDADVNLVAKAIGLDKRISPKFLRAGLGYGGSCFPKDLKALIAFSNQSGYEPFLLQSVQTVNDDQARHTIDLLQEELGDLSGKKIAILGLSFKPNTDDMREAKSIPLIKQLLNRGAKIVAYDPVAISNAKSIFRNKIEYASSSVNCLENADGCILVTEWKEFQKLGPEDFKQHMKTPILIDSRRIYDPKQFSRKIRFKAIGLGTNANRY